MIPELSIFFSAMLPFVDLKLAIPLGIKLGLSGTTTFLFAVSGSMIPAALTIFLLEPVSKFARKHSLYIDRFCEKLFSKTRNSHSKNFQRYGALFLILFVAIPLPGSGSASGALVSFIFGIEKWKALSMITIGTATAGVLLLAGFESVFALLKLF